MAGKLTFRGGVHPLRRIHHGKPLTEKRAIEPCSAPGEVVLPLSQHIGAPSVPIAAVGDRVDMGQKIAEASGNVSVPCYASVSGTVRAIEPRPDIAGQSSLSIVIANDFEDRPCPAVRARGSVESLSPSALLDIIKDAGIVGMGGAAFPTHIKLSPPPEKKIGLVIVNGAECEPYLTADHRLMLEHPEGVITGLRAAMKILGARQGCVALEANKPDAAAAIREAAKGEGIRVVTLRVKYPQGAEKQLINAITGRQVPSGGLPMDVGAIVINAGTAYQISLSIEKGLPLTQRVVTVSGSVARPSNFLVRLGTPISHVFAQAGGFSSEIVRVIGGGADDGHRAVRPQRARRQGHLGAARARRPHGAAHGGVGLHPLRQVRGMLPDRAAALPHRRLCRGVPLQRRGKSERDGLHRVRLLLLHLPREPASRAGHPARQGADHKRVPQELLTLPDWRYLWINSSCPRRLTSVPPRRRGASCGTCSSPCCPPQPAAYTSLAGTRFGWCW
jgi:electron transport complex, RnfABCDGE type, C subunit